VPTLNDDTFNNIVVPATVSAEEPAPAVILSVIHIGRNMALGPYDAKLKIYNRWIT